MFGEEEVEVDEVIVEKAENLSGCCTNQKRENGEGR